MRRRRSLVAFPISHNDVTGVQPSVFNRRSSSLWVLEISPSVGGNGCDGQVSDDSTAVTIIGEDKTGSYPLLHQIWAAATDQAFSQDPQCNSV